MRTLSVATLVVSLMHACLKGHSKYSRMTTSGSPKGKKGGAKVGSIQPKSPTIERPSDRGARRCLHTCEVLWHSGEITNDICELARGGLAGGKIEGHLAHARLGRVRHFLLANVQIKLRRKHPSLSACNAT